MQQVLHKQSVMMTKPLMDATTEYILSGDFILPDYCMDVAMVLKCVVTPYIHTRRMSGDLLTLDGTVAVRVLYLDEERRCVRVAEFTQPLSCSLRGQCGSEGAPVSVKVETEYVNCRAVSPRRIEVRGGLTVSAYAAGCEEMELPVAAEDEKLCVRRLCRRVCAPLTSAEKTVSVNELLSFDASLPAAEQLLGGECTVAVTDCKLLTDKAIVKGHVYLHHLYTDDSLAGSTHVLEYTVPFSLIMDVAGARDGMLHCASASIITDTQECVAGVNGPNTALDFTAKLLVQLYVYESVEMQLLTDAFHCERSVTATTQSLCMRSLCGAAHRVTTVQKRVVLPCDNLQEVIDVWIMPLPGGSVSNGRAEWAAPVTVCMLVRDVDGIVAYHERQEELTLPLSHGMDAGDEMQVHLTVCGVSYTAGGDSLDLRLSVAMTMTQWQVFEQTVITDLELTDERFADDVPALRLYYADPGERVWDIARHCHASPDSICAENGLHDDVVREKTVLIVPAK